MEAEPEASSREWKNCWHLAAMNRMNSQLQGRHNRFVIERGCSIAVPTSRQALIFFDGIRNNQQPRQRVTLFGSTINYSNACAQVKVDRFFRPLKACDNARTHRKKSRDCDRSLTNRLTHAMLGKNSITGHFLLPKKHASRPLHWPRMRCLSLRGHVRKIGGPLLRWKCLAHCVLSNQIEISFRQYR